MNIPVYYYLTVGAILFFIGIYGVLRSRGNLLFVLISLEILTLAVELNFITFASAHGDVSGQAAVLIILAISAVEIALGLSIFMMYYKKHGHVRAIDMTKLKG